jgi:ParB-like nuclease family protein
MAVPSIPAKTTGVVPTKLLDFDPSNPRLIESGIDAPSDAQIIKVLADGSDLSELVASIATNGYIDIEPLIVQRIDDRFRVLEGNRRLAAIRILQEPSLAKGTGIAVPPLKDEVKKSLNKVTAYAVSSPDQARDFIGFKHINGPHKWDAIAKARFAADWYKKERNNGDNLEKIAQRLGDGHDTVVRLVNGMFVLDQAEEAKVFEMNNRYPGRKFAFSHLYTALTRPGYREFLGLPEEWRAEDPKPNPVPKNKLENLRTLMIWLYGSKSDEIEPVINSQNPDIKNLGVVLTSARARTTMLLRSNLREAYALVEPKGIRFEAALINAKQETEKAISQIAGYDPTDSTLLEIGEDLRDTSEQLYTSMSSISKKATSRKNKR